MDELRFTLPCQDVTLLKLLNKYGTTKTAHLFTKLQGELADIINELEKSKKLGKHYDDDFVHEYTDIPVEDDANSNQIITPEDDYVP